MSQGHSVGTAFESLAANASWIPGESEVRATLASPRTGGSGGGSGSTSNATPSDEAARRAAEKKREGEVKNLTKLLEDQRKKSDRLAQEVRRTSSFPNPRDSYRRDTGRSRDSRDSDRDGRDSRDSDSRRVSWRDSDHDGRRG